MTYFERKLLIVLIAVACILSLTIGWGVIQYGIKNSEQVVQKPQVVEEESVAFEPLEEDERAKVFQTFRQKVAPVEVGPVHREVEAFVNSTFQMGTQYTYQSFEEALRPRLDAYFTEWERRMAEETLMLYGKEIDPDLVEEMLTHGGYEEKIHFMLLYERVYLIEKGILIDQDK